MVSNQRLANIYFKCYFKAIFYFSKLKSENMTTLGCFLFSE